MFDSLSDRIKADANIGTTPAQRFTQWVVVLAVSVVLFGGLYYAVRALGE